MAPVAMGLKTLQSHMSLSTSTTTTTTTKPWPKIDLSEFSASPADPWTFVPHRKPTMGPTNTRNPSPTTHNPRTANHQPEYPPAPPQEPTTVYQRHTLPSQVRRMSLVGGYMMTTTPSTVQQTKPTRHEKHPSYRTDEEKRTQSDLLVSIPKIFADMALTGQFGKITIPRDRIR